VTVRLVTYGVMPYTLCMATSRHSKTSRRPAAKSRTARLEARITQAQKALIERAAACQGRSVTDFVVATLATAAQAAIREHEVIELNAAQSRAFVEVLLNPPEPNEALRKAFRRHSRIVVSR
jgi:uncharacterized protein (DUF1778 family)